LIYLFKGANATVNELWFDLV